ncbi:MAG TPA: nucleotidyltransferase family protein, partial [Dongiaceae bacterium]|nr:nucleotidyltransferase family protein [Dongiaceae bacterium]
STLVRRAAERAYNAGVRPIVVVLGHEAERVRTALAGIPCEFAVNPEFTGPTSGSLHLGLQRLADADADAAVVMLADMVHVTHTMIGAVIRAARTNLAPLVVSRYGDVVAPPLLFTRALFPELMAWHGEGCGKQVVMKHLLEAEFIDWDPAALADVDTPEDFAALPR